MRNAFTDYCVSPEGGTSVAKQQFYGPTGTGKSKKASEFNDAYWQDDTQWWEGYDKQETVVLDDFRSSNMKFNHLFKVLDRYPMIVQNKGGYRQLNSKNIIIIIIIITTNKHPKDCYNLPGKQIEQLLRRIDVIQEFDPIINWINIQKLG